MLADITAEGNPTEGAAAAALLPRVKGFRAIRQSGVEVKQTQSFPATPVPGDWATIILAGQSSRVGQNPTHFCVLIDRQSFSDLLGTASITSPDVSTHLRPG